MVFTDQGIIGHSRKGEGRSLIENFVFVAQNKFLHKFGGLNIKLSRMAECIVEFFQQAEGRVGVGKRAKRDKEIVDRAYASESKQQW